MTDEQIRHVYNVAMALEEHHGHALRAVAKAERAEALEEVRAALQPAINSATDMIQSEILGGNVVKENWSRGESVGLRIAEGIILELKEQP